MSKNYLFDNPKNVRILKIASYVCLGIVVVVDFFVPREHVHYPWDHIPGFYALFGFIACILIIVIAKTLGYKWLMKKEDYYD